MAESPLPSPIPPDPEREAQHRAAEDIERRRQLRGLLILAFIVIAFSIARAGTGNVFPHGWWRVW